MKSYNTEIFFNIRGNRSSFMVFFIYDEVFYSFLEEDCFEAINSIAAIMVNYGLHCSLDMGCMVADGPFWLVFGKLAYYPVSPCLYFFASVFFLLSFHVLLYFSFPHSPHDWSPLFLSDTDRSLAESMV